MDDDEEGNDGSVMAVGGMRGGVGVEDDERRCDDGDGDGSGEGRGDKDVEVVVIAGSAAECPKRAWPALACPLALLAIVLKLSD